SPLVLPARSSGVYRHFTGRLDVVPNSLRRSGWDASASRRVVSSHRFSSFSRTLRSSSSRMSASRGFKGPCLYDGCAVHSVAVDSTIVFARPWKACSTFSPVFADVYITGHSYDARTVDASSVFTSRRCVRSVLFPRAYTGTGPTESRTPSIHLVRSRSDCARVMSKTARTPLAPWKYASLKSWRNVGLTIMFRIIMSTWTGRPCIEPRATVFFEPPAPSVRMYDSSNAPDTNRWMRLVLPT